LSWKVYYVEAFVAWVADQAPDEARMELVQQWIDRAIAYGPPPKSYQVGGLASDTYVAPIYGANVRATFLAVWQDRWMKVQRFR
jgi:hypothetical protein